MKKLYKFTIFFILLILTFSSLGANPAYALSNSPLANMPTTNGIVRAIAPDGAGGVYIGGNFTQLTPSGGGSALTRNAIAHINADGTIAPWDPNVNAGGNVQALVVSGSTVYVGGYFTNIGGQARNYIAALDATTGLATAWNPNANGYVDALAVSGNTVYVGGPFGIIGGQARNRIAALDATTGLATSWDPNSNGTVRTIAVSGSTVYAGGDFTSIGGQARNRIAALDVTTGLATAWDPNASFIVYTLAVSGNTVYAGGAFNTIGGQTRGRIAALDATTGNATAWNPNANNNVWTLTVSGSTVYAGGQFTSIGGQTRNNIAELDATTGNATTWASNANALVRALAVSGSALYVGGDFTTIGGGNHPYFAAFGGLDTTSPSIVSTNLSASYTTTGPDIFTVTFSEDVDITGGATGTDSATNPANYLLVDKGTNGTTDTASCAGGVAADDTKVTVNSVSYNNAAFTSTVTLASALPVGSYRLFVCGTTSIVDLASNVLNGGSDYTFDFVVQAATTTTTTTTAASSLPSTGFPQGRISVLSEQPAAKAYTDTAMTLEIPKLGISMPIVGVPQTDGEWDVSWLGNSAGYLSGSAFPTWVGNTVLTGHVWDAYNQPGPFAELKSLKYGDQIQIQAWGQIYTYEVRESKIYWAKAASSKVFQHEEYDWVTLLTCEAYNPFTGAYFLRRAVRAVLVSVQ